MNHQAIKQEIRAADQAINNKDFDAVAKFYENDAALVIRPDLLAYGRKNIREAHKKISEYFNGSLEVSQGDMVVIEAGNTALVLAKTFVKSSERLDSEYSTERDAIYVYVKDDSGKWLCAIDNSYGVELLKKQTK
ncbi:MAG: DUF4440 domain-containing protein [Halopseudomonas aestusnigri]